MRILISLLLILILSVSDIFLYRSGILPIEPSLFLVPLLVFLVFANKKYLQNLKVIKGNSVRFLIYLFLLGIIFSPLSTSNDILYTLGLNLLNLTLFVVSYLYFSSISINVFRRIFLTSIIILGLSIVSDLFFSEDIINRGAGFAENPNSSAQRIVFLLTLLMLLFKDNKYKFLILAVGILFVLLTLSRSGMIMLVVAIFVFQIFGFNTNLNFSKIKKRFVKYTVSFIAIIFIFLALLDFIVDIVPVFQTPGAIVRIEQFKGNSDLISELDMSEQGRVSILKDYFNLFLDQPYGYGTAMNINRNFYPHSTHNTFLRIAIDFGIVGLIIFILFILKGFQSGYQFKNVFYFTFFLIFFLSSFFTNTVLENRTFIIVLAALDVLKYRKYHVENY